MNAQQYRANLAQVLRNARRRGNIVRIGLGAYWLYRGQERVPLRTR